MSCKKSYRHLFRKLKILPLPSQYALSSLLFVINNRYQFTINSEIHNTNSRQFNNFHQPRYNLSKYQEGLQHWHTQLCQSGICMMCWNSGIQFDVSSQSFNTCVLNFIHQHSQFLGMVPDPGVWTIILLLLSCVGQQRALAPNGLFAVVKRRVQNFLVVQRKSNPKEASNNSSFLL
jgi:hypothetical protein